MNIAILYIFIRSYLFYYKNNFFIKIKLYKNVKFNKKKYNFPFSYF